jgi:hypothetical protein
VTAEGVEEGAEEAEAPEPPKPVRPPALVLAVSLAVLFGILAVVFAVLAASGDGDGEGSGVTSLRRAAGEMAEAFFTWDYQDLDAHRDRVLSLSTGSFRKEYEEQFDAGIRDVITQTKSSSKAFVQDVYVSEVEEERAEAVVVVDLEQDGAAGPRNQRDIYVVITFVDVDGSWKVDDVTDPFPATGGLPTSTTSPGAPVP